MQRNNILANDGLQLPAVRRTGSRSTSSGVQQSEEKESESLSLLSISSDCVLQILISQSNPANLFRAGTDPNNSVGTPPRSRTTASLFVPGVDESRPKRGESTDEQGPEPEADNGSIRSGEADNGSIRSGESSTQRTSSMTDATSSTSMTPRNVPISCAICLSKYKVGDEVTWSSNSECKHCFHKGCISQWLSKKDNSLCPCCRREFLDIDKLKDEGWIGDESMNELKERIRSLFHEPPPFVFSSPFQ